MEENELTIFKQIVCLCEAFNDSVCWDAETKKDLDKAFADRNRANELFLSTFTDKTQKDFDDVCNNSGFYYRKLFNVSKGSYYSSKKQFIDMIRSTIYK